MRINTLLVAAAILIPAFPASAQQDLIKGVYARSAEQCAAAKKNFNEFVENGELVLTTDGIEGVEYNCQIVDWKARKRGPGAVATMLCEEPGFATPEIYAVMPRGEGELEFTLSSAISQGEEPGNYGMWYLCKGVKLPAQ